MKKIKLLLIFLLTFTIFPTSINANETEINDDISIKEVQGKPVTFDEMLNNIADYKNITYDEALDDYLENTRKNLPMTYNLNPISDDELLETARRLNYWEDDIYVWSSTKKYTAAIYVYYSYIGSVQNRCIEKILDVGVRCNVDTPYKHYNGTLFINLETNYKYFYRLNGAFYNTGTTTTGVNVNISLGQSANLTLGSSTSSNFYDGVYATGRIVSSRGG